MTKAKNIRKAVYSSEEWLPEAKTSLYTVLAHIYFFFNSFLLPKGLLYTYILSPFFFLRQILKKRKTGWKLFFGFLVIYDCIHLFHGVDLITFRNSNLLFILTYFCRVSFITFFPLTKKQGKYFGSYLSLISS